VSIFIEITGMYKISLVVSSLVIFAELIPSVPDVVDSLEVVSPSVVELSVELLEV